MQNGESQGSVKFHAKEVTSFVHTDEAYAVSV
jgi:hypothetical protein